MRFDYNNLPIKIQSITFDKAGVGFFLNTYDFYIGLEFYHNFIVIATTSIFGRKNLKYSLQKKENKSFIQFIETFENFLYFNNCLFTSQNIFRIKNYLKNSKTLQNYLNL